MDIKTNVKEEVASSEKDFVSSDSERTFENDSTTSQQYFEMHNKINIRMFDILDTGLPNEGEPCSTICERKSGNGAIVGRKVFEMEHKINIKDEVDSLDTSLSTERELLCTNRERNYGNDITMRNEFEMANKIIKTEDDTSILNESDFENRLKNDTSTFETHFEFNNIESKEWAFVSDVGIKEEVKCFSADLEKEKFITYSEYGESGVKRMSAETECHSEVPLSNCLLHNDNRDDKLQDLVSAESSRLYEQEILPDTFEGEEMKTYQIDKTVSSISDNNCSLLLYSEQQPLNKCTTLKNEATGKIFAGKASLKVHDVHEDKNVHKCNVCHENFTLPKNLKKHKLIHDGLRPYECKTCKKRFADLTSLNRHSLIHEGIKPYKCKICKKKFTNTWGLNRHNLIHEDIRPHECNICRKRFTQLSNLYRHSLSHEGKKPHECNVCKKKFIRLSDMKRHILIHEGKKPHECNVCMKKFIRLSDMKRHSLIHEGRKPHECIICKKRFTRLSTLNTHSLIHKGGKGT